MTVIDGPTPPTTNGFTTEQFDAARRIIREFTEQEESPIGIYQLLEEMGEDARSMYWLLDLIHHLQADPNIRQLTSDWYPIEFEWDDEQRVHGLYSLGGQPW